MSHSNEQQPISVSEISLADKKERRKPGRKARLLALAGVAVSLAGGLSACNSAGAVPVPSQPVSVGIETATPKTEVVDQAEVQKKKYEAYIASFGIPAGQFTTPEAVTTEFVAQYSKFLNAGINGESYDPTDWYSVSLDSTEVAMKAKYDTPIMEKVFTSSASGVDLTTNIEKSLRQTNIEIGFNTQGLTDPARRYVMDLELVGAPSITPIDSSSFIADTTLRETDNGNLNIGPNQLKAGKPAQTDITRFDELTFKLDPTTNSWKVDRDTFTKAMEVNSK